MVDMTRMIRRQPAQSGCCWGYLYGPTLERSDVRVALIIQKLVHEGMRQERLHGFDLLMNPRPQRRKGKPSSRFHVSTVKCSVEIHPHAF